MQILGVMGRRPPRTVVVRKLELSRGFVCDALRDTIFSRSYPRNAMLARVLAVIVCLSVRPSVTSRHCTKTSKRKITQTTSRDSPGILSSLCVHSLRWPCLAVSIM